MQTSKRQRKQRLVESQASFELRKLKASLPASPVRLALVSPVHSWADTGDTLPEFKATWGEGEGEGEQSEGTLPLLPADCLDFLPVRLALASGHCPAGPLLSEAQAQMDLARARRQADKLTRSMIRAGARVGSEVARDAAADGVCALVAWRQVFGPRCRASAALVSWRACVRSVAVRDLYGESLEDWRESEGDTWQRLTASACPPAIVRRCLTRGQSIPAAIRAHACQASGHVGA